MPTVIKIKTEGYEKGSPEIITRSVFDILTEGDIGDQVRKTAKTLDRMIGLLYSFGKLQNIDIEEILELEPYKDDSPIVSINFED